MVTGLETSIKTTLVVFSASETEGFLGVFGFEPEITAKVARGDWRVYEVPISYAGRTYEQGKKITWKDGFQALWCIVRYRFKD